MKQRMRYPADFEPRDFIAYDQKDLEDAWVEALSTVDRLDGILAKADPHAIVAWLDQDPRLEQWRRKGDEDARLCVKPFRKQIRRSLVDQTLPSFISWRIETAEWVPTGGGEKTVPTRCTMDRSLPEEVQRVLRRPALQSNHPLLKGLQLDEQRIRHAIERAGVRHSLHSLGWDEFYTLLLNLPYIDPEGRSARTLYRTLFGRAEAEDPEGANYERFRREGKLWGSRDGKTGYFDVRVLYYDDNGMVPARIRNMLPLFQFDRRRGSQKVCRLFGVEPLKGNKIGIRVDEVRPSPRALELTHEIDRLKPFAYAMRQFADAHGGGLARLRNLGVRLCDGLTAKATVGSKPYAIELMTPADLLMDDSTAYVIAGPTAQTPLLKDELLADAVGEIFATVFQIENGSDFARLASCSEERRTALLARVLGIDTTEATSLVIAARNKLDLPPETSGSRANPWVDPPGNGEVRMRDQGQAVSHSDGTSQAFSPPPAATPASTAPPEPGGAVTAVAQPRPVLPPPRTIQLRVRATPRGPAEQPSLPSGRPVTDPVHCQELATWFEEAEGQGRFPLLVDHLQGKDAYGCDFLSFDTAAYRDRFRAQPNVNLVARFIEVKGRGHAHDRVELRGNELQAALRYKDRFFVYRVYDSDGGNYEIAVLPDPTVASCEIVYDIDVSRASTTTLWRVTEITRA